MQKAIDQAYAKGFLGKNILGSGFDLEMYVHMGAGSYECGEETALMSSLMGERGMPRHKPPAVPLLSRSSGVWGLPVGGQQCRDHRSHRPDHQLSARRSTQAGTVQCGTRPGPASKGTKLITISGHVNKPGNYEIVLGTPIREMHLRSSAGGIP